MFPFFFNFPYLLIALNKFCFYYEKQAIFCIIYVVIVYLLTSQPLEWSRFSMFLSSCLLIAFVAQSVGLVVGAAMNVQVSHLHYLHIPLLLRGTVAQYITGKATMDLGWIPTCGNGLFQYFHFVVITKQRVALSSDVRNVIF